jgi:ABC-2 type transport system permease protein
VTLAIEREIRQAEPKPAGFWGASARLIRLRVLVAIRGFMHTGKLHKLLTSMVALMASGMVIGMFVAFLQVMNSLRSPEILAHSGDLSVWFLSMPSLIMSGIFMGTLFTSFGALLQALYLSNDTDFLLSTPMPIRAVFFTKLLQGVAPNFAVACLFAVPLLFALGVAEGYTLLYYFASVLQLAGLALAAAGISAVVVMVVVRVFPARRVAEVIGFLGAVSMMLCSQVWQLAQLGSSSEQQIQMLNMTLNIDNAFSPLAWGGRGLTAIGQGNWLLGLSLTGLILLLSGAVFYVSILSAEKLYYSGWARLQIMPRRPPKPLASSAAQPRAGWRRLLDRLVHQTPAPMRLLIWKDWLVLRRDLRNMSQMIAAIIMGLIYAFGLFTIRRQAGINPNVEMPVSFIELLDSISTYTSVSIALIVSTMLLSRIAGMAFAHEGRSYWILQTAPIQLKHLMLAKYLVAYLPALTIGLGYLLLAWLLQGSGADALLYAIIVVMLTVAGDTGLSLTFGVLGTNLGWEDPRQMQRMSIGCLSSVITLTYLSLAMAVFFTPPVVALFLQLPEWLGQALGLSMGAMLCLLAALTPLLVRKQVQRLGMK